MTPKIPHHAILASSQGCRIPEIYRSRVLPANTRTIRLLGKKTNARILTTLLGYEVQASYKRIQCPDLVTAQYLRVFSELGCHSIKLPYDPTLTSELVPGLEAALAELAESVRRLFPAQPRLQSYVLRKIYSILRRQLRAG